MQNGVGLFQNLFLQNYWARRAHIYMKAFWCNVDSCLFTSCSPEVGRGNNREKHNYMCLYSKQFFSRTSWLFSIKLRKNRSWVKDILNCSNKGPGPLQRGDNHKNAKIWLGQLKIFFFLNHWARRAHIYMKAFWFNVDSELFTSWSPGVALVLNRENYIYICLFWKKNFFRTSRPISIKFGIDHP
jgi:hypothetical protein